MAWVDLFIIAPSEFFSERVPFSSASVMAQYSFYTPGALKGFFVPRPPANFGPGMK